MSNYNAEVSRLKGLIKQARTDEMVARATGEGSDRAKIIEAVRVRKNAQAELASLVPPPFNAVRIVGR